MILKLAKSEVIDSGASAHTGSYIVIDGDKYSVNLGDLLEIEDKLNLVIDSIYGYYSPKTRNLKNPQTFEIIPIKAPKSISRIKVDGEIYFDIKEKVSTNDIIYGFGEVWVIKKETISPEDLAYRVKVEKHKTGHRYS